MIGPPVALHTIVDATVAIVDGGSGGTPVLVVMEIAVEVI